MKLLGKLLIGPRVAATLLSLYALMYSCLLVLLSFSGAPDAGDLLFSVGLLALACTPFAAFDHLLRAVDPAPKRPARPGVMALVMALPSAYWCWMVVDVNGWSPLNWGRLFFLVGAPAVLSLWLMITFALLWWRDRRA